MLPNTDDRLPASSSLTRFAAITLLSVAALALGPDSAAAQEYAFSGEFFGDYDYVVDSPDDARNGENAFGYRRVRVTADYTLSDRFKGRVRFDAKSSAHSGGRPNPFVKDMYLTWKDVFAEGHALTFGVSPTPNFRLSESVWGYRAVEKTIQDRQGIVESRDLGLKLEGPLGSAGVLSYRVMIANNSELGPETDKYKRAYGVLEYRSSSSLRAAAGADFFRRPDGSTANIYGFVGAVEEAWRAGIEAFVSPVSTDGAEDVSRYGVSAFGAVSTSERGAVVARFDTFGTDQGGETADGAYAVLGYSHSPDASVRIIPNIEYSLDEDADDPLIRARLTLHARF